MRTGRYFGVALLALTLIGGALRYASPGRVDLWRDEAQLLAIASLATPAAIRGFLEAHESHPPLFYWLAHAIGKATGDLEAGMSLVSLVAATMTIPLAGYAGRQIFSAPAGVLAASMVALSMPLSFFSVQIRPYGLLALLWLGSTYAFVRMATGAGRFWPAVWAILTALGLWTHHATLVLLAAQAAVGAGFRFSAGRTVAIGRPVVLAIAALALLWAPTGKLFFNQLTVASYATIAPMSITTPWRQLATLLLEYPLELLLPLAGAAITLGAPGLADRLPPAGRLMILLAAGFMLLATIGTYRSHFLTPHLMLTVAPIGLVGFGGLIVAVHARKPVGGAVLLEAAIVAMVLGVLFGRAVRKSNTREAAQVLRREAASSDVVILTPGFLGVSLNRYFDGPQLEIDFPSIGRVAPYPFDRHFDRVSDTTALRVVRDSIDGALNQLRVVWLVAPTAWLRPDASAPVVLTADSFGGLSQAERSRANFMFRYLERRAGPPTVVLRGDRPGMEQVSLFRFGAGWTGTP